MLAPERWAVQPAVEPDEADGFTWELRGSQRLPASVYYRSSMTASRVNGKPFDRRGRDLLMRWHHIVIPSSIEDHRTRSMETEGPWRSCAVPSVPGIPKRNGRALGAPFCP
jgi:hypothetical protein